MKSLSLWLFSVAALGLLALPRPLSAQTTSGATTLYSFTGSGADGANPLGGLVQDAQGNFYGTTVAGGTHGVGTVFKMTPDGAVSTLYAFTGGSDGSDPNCGLVLGNDGNLYGTTYDGGIAYGTVFQVTPTGVLTTLYLFTGSADGANPEAALVQGSDGKFYGTTLNGGAANDGTVFSITPTGEFTTLHSFSAVVGINRTNPDGAHPNAGLVAGGDGSFYGVTAGGGDGLGTVFKIAPDGTLTVLHNFSGTNGEGSLARGGLVQAGDGNFYGTTEVGGTAGYGTLFRLTPAGALTPLHSFAQSSPEGTSPLASLIVGPGGALYGTTSAGFAVRGGIYEITIGGDFTALYGFTGTSGDGANPGAPLLLGKDGYLYGTTHEGGANGAGTIFRLSAPLTVAAPSVVSITVAGDGQAVVGGENGKVVVTRTGDLTKDLTVSYKAKGTATAGVDYQALPDTVTIPAGATKAKIKVKPIAGSPSQGTLNIKLKLTPATDGSYTIGSDAKAKIVLQEQN